MDPRRIASIAAVVGGIGWLVKVVLIALNGGSNTDSGLVGVMYLVGLVGLVIALGAAGYTLVETAPPWLRAVVVVATPLLVMMLWQMVNSAIQALYTAGGWLEGELGIILAGVLGLVLGAWGFTRHRDDETAQTIAAGRRAVRGRRAAR